jgi:hypothetical protein
VDASSTRQSPTGDENFDDAIARELGSAAQNANDNSLSQAVVIRGAIGVSIRRLTIIASAHYMSAEGLEKRNYHFTNFIIFFITVLLFVSNLDTYITSPSIKLMVGFASALAVALAAIQYASKDQELINQHKTAGGNFSGIRRELELMLTLSDFKLVNRRENLERLLDKYVVVASHSPIIRRRLLRAAKKYVECHEKDQIDFYAKLSVNSVAVSEDDTSLVPRDRGGRR